MTDKHIDAIVIEPMRSVQRQIADQLREAIKTNELAGGTALPATRVLAKRWDTNRATVHLALSQLVKEGWLIRTPRVGTFIRKREKKLTCVGVYGTVGSFRESLFEQALQAALKEELIQAGIEMDLWLDPRPVKQHGEPWRSLVEAAERREFQALIAIWERPWQRKLPLPVSCAGGAAPTDVGFDYRQFFELVLRTLAAQGCRSVGLIAGWRSSVVGFHQPFTDISQDAGLAIKNSWIRIPQADHAMPHEQYGYEQFKQLWEQEERPAGLIVYPDSIARGVIAGLLEKQVRVPDQLRLLLHKNEGTDLFCPVPATFAISSERELAKALIAQVESQFRGARCERILVPFHVAGKENQRSQ